MSVNSNGRLKRRPRDQTAGIALGDLMRSTPGLALAAALAACTWLGPACASEPLHCGRFAQETLPSPIPQKGMHALDRAEEITRAVKSAAYVVLFFGDSLTEHWDSTVWAQSLAPRGALNAGGSGDRTAASPGDEHSTARPVAARGIADGSALCCNHPGRNERSGRH